MVFRRTADKDKCEREKTIVQHGDIVLNPMKRKCFDFRYDLPRKCYPGQKRSKTFLTETFLKRASRSSSCGSNSIIAAEDDDKENVPRKSTLTSTIIEHEQHRTGLTNLGNTCYLNSIVQCLVHLPGLSEYFCREGWKENFELQLNRKSVITDGEVSVGYHAVLQEMICGHRSIAILDFKNIVGKYHEPFNGYGQQDSHELLTILLDWMHEELNQVVKTPLREQKNDGLSDTKAALKAWNNYVESNRSTIVDLFCGQQKSLIRCLSCEKESVTFDIFFNLTVPIPNSSIRKIDILQCIELYTTEEILTGWYCLHCKSIVRATKKIDLWRLPRYLIIHLQRFYDDGGWKKRLNEVDFPVDNLDLQGKVEGLKCIQDVTLKPTYSLQAVSNHFGRSMDGGHYTAYCRKNGQWANFDDHNVSQINATDVVSSAAYILFYCNNGQSD